MSSRQLGGVKALDVEAASTKSFAAERLPLLSLLSFAAAPAGYAFCISFVQFYFLKYSTDVLLIAPVIIAFLLGPGRIWDALSDPLVGYLSDSTKSRWGRRRPWLFIGAPLVAVSFVVLWLPPASLTESGQIIWLAVCMFLFYTCFTLYYIPYMAFAAEITTNYDERSKLFGSIRAIHIVGTLAAFAALQLSDTSADPKGFVAVLVIVAGALCCALMLITPFSHRERPENQGRGAKSPFAAFRDVLKNPHARLVLVVVLIDYMGIGVMGAITPYYAEYVLNQKVAGYAFASYALGGLTTIPFWVWLSRRIEKRHAWTFAMTVTGAAFSALFFIDAGQQALFFVMLYLAGAGANAAGSAIGQSILADIIDDDEHKTGERKEGAYSALWGFSLKMGVGLVVMVAGVILQGVGYIPNEQQSPETVQAIRLLMSAFPAALFFIGAILFHRFTLDRETCAKIREELDQRLVSKKNIRGG